MLKGSRKWLRLPRAGDNYLEEEVHQGLTNVMTSPTEKKVKNDESSQERVRDKNIIQNEGIVSTELVNLGQKYIEEYGSPGARELATVRH